MQLLGLTVSSFFFFLPLSHSLSLSLSISPFLSSYLNLLQSKIICTENVSAVLLSVCAKPVSGAVPHHL